MISVSTPQASPSLPLPAKPSSVMEVPEAALRFESSSSCMDEDKLNKPLVTHVSQDDECSTDEADSIGVHEPATPTDTSDNEDVSEPTKQQLEGVPESQDEQQQTDKAPCPSDATAETLDSSTASDSSANTLGSEMEAPTPTSSRTLGGRHRSSLKLQTNLKEGDLYISSKKKSWKCLPAPNMKDVLSRATSTESTCSTAASTCSESSRGRKGVAFGDVMIREYDMTLGDNPSVSYGPPVSLDWMFEQHKPIDMDDYEAHRGQRRNLRQMMMNYYQRKNLLLHTYGYSEQELKKAERQANRTKNQRAMTKTFLQFSKVMDVVESTGRKTKRMVSGKKNKQ